MCRRLVQSILVAGTLAVGLNGPIAAAPPLFVVCHMPEGNVLNVDELPILVAGFDSMAAAVHQCVFFWNGRPSGVER